MPHVSRTQGRRFVCPKSALHQMMTVLHIFCAAPEKIRPAADDPFGNVSFQDCAIANHKPY